MTRSSGGRILNIMLDTDSSVPLYRQIYSQIRTAVLTGRLKPRASLPSTRALAQDLKVSRSTAVLAYDQLRAEGYLSSRLGGGTRISDTIPEALLRTEVARPTLVSAAKPRAISDRPARVAREVQRIMPPSTTPRAFRSGVPALDAFPIDLWSAAIGRALRRMPGRSLSLGDPYGLEVLRESVAEYLAVARGVRCTPQQIMIVNGSQQALALCATVLLDSGDEAWLEDPGYVGARGALEMAGARVIPIGVDDEGLVVSEGRERAPNAHLAFVTPSRQLPLGVTMSLTRRLALLQWAVEAESWVIEDDYDSEFRYSSRPLTALQGLDQHGCVLYTGTFSKVMFPALRLGYMVVPDSLHDVFLAARQFADIHSSHLEQVAMAAFMKEGHFERHIRRMRATYLERRQLLIEAIEEMIGERFTIRPPDAGMNLIAWLAPGTDDVAIAERAQAAGVVVMPVSTTPLEHPVPPGLLLGFSGVSPLEIREGVATLAEVLNRYDRERRVAVSSA